MLEVGAFLIFKIKQNEITGILERRKVKTLVG